MLNLKAIYQRLNAPNPGKEDRSLDWDFAKRTASQMVELDYLLGNEGATGRIASRLDPAKNFSRQIKRAIDLAHFAIAAYAPSPQEGVAVPSLPDYLKNDWVAEKPFIDPESGFRAVPFRNIKTGEVILAFAGTDELTDLIANGGQALGIRARQYQLGIDKALELQRIYGSKLTLTGHSLGGGIASAAALVTGLRAVTFNPAGIHLATVKRYGGSLANADRLIEAYLVVGEFLNLTQDRIEVPNTTGTTYYISGKHYSPLARHGMSDVLAGLQALLDRISSSFPHVQE